MLVAVLDLGTNTFHLLIAEVDHSGSWKKILARRRSVKLGEGAIHLGQIASGPFKRGITVLREFRRHINRLQPEVVLATATAAIRDASNSEDFIGSARELAGIEIKTISGEEEAELIYEGVRQCVQFGEETELIMDIGGGSVEFIITSGDGIKWKRSFRVGAARLKELFRPSDPIQSGQILSIREFLDQELSELHNALRHHRLGSLVGSAGSFETYAEMISWKKHGKNVFRNQLSMEIDRSEFRELHDALISSNATERMEMKGLLPMRVDMIVFAAILTQYIVERYQIRKIKASAFSLREGLMIRATREMFSGSDRSE